MTDSIPETAMSSSPPVAAATGTVSVQALHAASPSASHRAKDQSVAARTEPLGKRLSAAQSQAPPAALPSQQPGKTLGEDDQLQF